jgi:hypothetical protein
MRFSATASFLLLTVLLLAGAQAEMLLRKHTSEDKRINAAMKHLHKTMFADSDLDQEEQECAHKGARQCAAGIVPALKHMSPDERTTFTDTITQQANAFETWVNAQGSDLDADAVFNYFDQNLANDPVTGAFWSCVEGSWKSCVSSSSSSSSS